MEMGQEQPGNSWQMQPPPPPPPVPNNYVPARFTHEEVVTSRERFDSCLREVHQQMGITFEKIPKVGGRELDLHMLYNNVTSLGGCERVISRKQWRDAAESFGFPQTITSVSFSLRKAYVSFLWDFEQIYYFRNTGPRIPPPVQKSKDEREDGAGGGEGDHHTTTTTHKKRRVADTIATEFPGLPPNAPNALTAFATHPAQTPAELYHSLVGSRGTVNVDARFDCGFFVTVKLGKQEFRGVLYYPPHDATIQWQPKGVKGAQSKKQDPLNVGQDLGDLMSPPMMSKAAKDKDPNAPKPNKTPFNFFSVDARIKAREMNPNATQAEITKKVGEMWQRAGDAEKAPYAMLSNQDKARYQAELEAYNYRLAAQASQAQATQVAAAVARAANNLAGEHPISNSLYCRLAAQAAQAQALQAAQAVAQAANSLAGNPPFSSALFAESLGVQGQEMNMLSPGDWGHPAMYTPR